MTGVEVDTAWSICAWKHACIFHQFTPRHEQTVSRSSQPSLLSLAVHSSTHITASYQRALSMPTTTCGGGTDTGGLVCVAAQ